MHMKIAIAGCSGRMGVALIKSILGMQGVSLAAGSVRAGSGLIGQEIGSLAGIKTPGVKLTASSDELFAAADAVIDFTTPEHSLQLVALAAQHKKIHICGTTGLNAAQKQALAAAGKSARIVWSANMSVGVNLLIGLVEKAAAILPANEYDIEIDEMHHKHKLDSPSGTALLLGDAAAKGREIKLADVRADVRAGARKQGDIGFSVRRGGEVIGDHTVLFAGMGDRIELTHKSQSRDIYAAGAIRAALWAKDKQPGFYSMQDVLF